jgi:uncharacterized phage protein (TIGR01671 family)
MREIKFRAWDKKYKEMISPEHLWKCTFYLCPCNGTFNAYGVDPDAPDDKDKEGMGENENLIPMQYTGLKDKNGQEIYEGDIVKYKYCQGTSKLEEGEKYEELVNQVEFSHGKFYPVPCFYDCYDSFYSFSYQYFEIIGNIYENKELLNDSN